MGSMEGFWSCRHGTHPLGALCNERLDRIARDGRLADVGCKQSMQQAFESGKGRRCLATYCTVAVVQGTAVSAGKLGIPGPCRLAWHRNSVPVGLPIAITAWKRKIRENYQEAGT